MTKALLIENGVVITMDADRRLFERGHVLALWREGRIMQDPSAESDKATLKLPDERHGLLYVFRTFEHMSYALILQVKEPVKPGDRFTQP